MKAKPDAILTSHRVQCWNVMSIAFLIFVPEGNSQNPLRRKNLINFFLSQRKNLSSWVVVIRKKIATISKKFLAAADKSTADKKLIFSLRQSNLPSVNQLKYIGKFLSKKETRIIQACVALISLSLIFLMVNIYKNKIQLVPANGGNYTEALIGTPKFINPLYSSINTVDNDLTALIYASLLKKDQDGNVVPDLADTFEVSEDGKIYTFYLKKNVLWQDKTAVSADDVVFTFQAIANSEYKSPWRISFTGVDVKKIDDATVSFTLAEPYAAFLELLTIGILPSHIWLNISPAAANLADFNLKPMGSGPYQFKSLTKDKTGHIKSYELEVNKNYYGRKPHVSILNFKFFSTIDEAIAALNENKVEGIDYLPKEYENKVAGKNNFNFYYLTQPQFTALFFNQNNLSVLKDIRVRQALAYGLDKKLLAASFSYALPINGPILPMFSDFYNDQIKKYNFDAVRARELLAAAGWNKTSVSAEDANNASSTDSLVGAGEWQKKNDEFLIVNLTTVDQPETAAMADVIKQSWQSIGIKVNLAIVPAQTIQTDIIRPRDYQILLYGAMSGSDPDQYPFWHSSQIGPNGLNLANYSNKNVDILLEDGRITNSKETRIKKYKEFQTIIADDLPAIFLSSLSYAYLQSAKIKGFDTSVVAAPSDRFANIANWYINTRKKIKW